MGSKKIFFDINIVIDFIDIKRPNHKLAKKLVHKLVLNDYQIVISEDMLSTIFYIQKDKKKTLEFFKVIQDDWMISSFGRDVIEDAIELSLNETLDLEDTLQCLCAKENDCEVLITNDIGFYTCGIKVMAIDKFLKQQQ